MTKQLRTFKSGIGMLLYKLSTFITLAFSYAVGVEFKYGFHLLNCVALCIMFILIMFLRIETAFKCEDEVYKEIEMVMKG